jgi:hypothetical protein
VQLIVAVHSIGRLVHPTLQMSLLELRVIDVEGHGLDRRRKGAGRGQERKEQVC